ncbi:hypothetical protein [Roseateles chitosanitabidus]|uniref:hypothetical protein n=1 Tax=Roseateles chitosanitabidus TaxID=65048 RepID=UPI00082B280F|nr:hypothetical protein [Roseateles chitosanitabidus]MBO9686271.1 hypothetical protein [Roseateles chitosanitabidus]
MIRDDLPGALTPSLIALAAALLCGCAATTTPKTDRQFSDATRALFAQQVLDPNAPARNAALTTRTDGRLMREAGVRAVDSYKAPPPSNIINIGVGAGGTDR